MRAALDPRLIALAGAAGCVDATAFLHLDEIFPANQTGNTVLLGIAVGRGDWTAALRSGVSLIAFCAGVLVLGYLVRRRPRGGWGREAALALGAEAALLLVLVAVWHTAPVAVAIALAAVAMGMQSLAAHRVGVAGVSTTFVTGTITRLSERLAGGVEQQDGVLGHQPHQHDHADEAHQVQRAAGDQQRQHHADQRQRQRQHHRQRRGEAAELHHQDEVHQRDAADQRDAHRDERLHAGHRSQRQHRPARQADAEAQQQLRGNVGQDARRPLPDRFSDGGARAVGEQGEHSQRARRLHQGHGDDERQRGEVVVLHHRHHLRLALAGAEVLDRGLDQHRRATRRGRLLLNFADLPRVAADFQNVAALDPANVLARRDTALIFERLGGLQAAAGNTASALDYYRRLQQVSSDWAARDASNAVAQHTLGVSHLRVSETQSRAGDRNAALQEAERALVGQLPVRLSGAGLGCVLEHRLAAGRGLGHLHRLGHERLEQRAEQAGFRLLTRELHDREHSVRVEKSVRIDGYTQHQGAHKNIRFSTVDFVGELEVTDALVFRKTLLNGIGHSKAFGCGLLLVRRL